MTCYTLCSLSICMYTATQTLVLTEQSEDQENEDDPFISANNEVYIITIV